MRPAITYGRTFLVLCLLYCATSLVAQEKRQRLLRDTLDNKFDITHYLTENIGVVPYIIPITEPAIGIGAVLGGVYFMEKDELDERPDLLTAAAGLTDNQSWVVGGAYIGFWNQDRIRYRGVFGYTDLNLGFYGEDQDKIAFEARALVFSQEMRFRLGNSAFFLGGKYGLDFVKIPLFDGSESVDPIDLDLVNSGFTAIGEYDQLNNPFSPTRGLKVHFSYLQNWEALGSTKNWGKFRFFSNWYGQTGERYLPALRLEANLGTGEIPFYSRPFIDLRGIPALRYQGDLTLLIETEHTYNLDLRWGVLAFGGLGIAYASLEDPTNNLEAWNYGAGIRYLLSRGFGIKAGMDVARGPEDWAVYVTVGTAWL